MPQPVRTKFVADSDKLYLEDELQRIILVGDLDVQTAVTGMPHSHRNGASISSAFWGQLGRGL